MTRDKIILVAMELFVNKGLGSTSIREISSVAGTNLASINYYFKSKKGLYKACLEKLSEIPFDLSKKALTEARCQNDAYSSLERFSSEIFSFYVDHSNLLLLALQETEKREISDFPNIEEVFNDLKKYFETLIKNKVIKKEFDPYILASMFLGLITQTIRYDGQRKERIGSNIKEDQELRHQYSKHIASVFCGGIFSE